MLESIREGVNKPWVKVLLAVVILSFIFAGVFTSNTLGTRPDTVAVVNGDEISERRWNDAVSAEAARYGEQFNAIFATDEAKFDFRKGALEKLANSVALEQELERIGFTASEQDVVNRVAEVPNFQVDGKFSVERLDAFLATRGWSREYFRTLIASDIANAQFLNLFSTTEIALPYEINEKVQLEQQQRDVKTLVVKSQPLEATVSVSDEEIEQHYNANITDYLVNETLTVDFIELKTESIAQAIEISDEQVKEFYDANSELYQSEEQRRVAHIQIKTEERSEEEAEAKIKALAEQIKGGADFAELAKAESEDFSAEQGGDLGFSGRGAMPEEFEKVMFELANVNDVSEPVKTEFGYHLIKLLELKDGDVRPLEEVKGQIVTQLKNQEAEDKFYELKSKMSEMAFDRYDSLDSAATAANVEVQTSAPFSRNSGVGIFANPQVIELAFGQSVLLDKRNSAPIDISDSHVVILRANEYTPERTKPLEEVTAEVTGSLRRKKARDLAAEKGAELVASLNSGNAIDTEVAELGLEWKNAQGVRRNSTELGFELTGMVFKAPKPVEGKAVAVGQAMLNGDFAVIQITKVTEPEIANLSDAEKEQSKARIQRMFFDSGYTSLVKSISNKSDIEILEEKLQ